MMRRVVTVFSATALAITAAAATPLIDSAIIHERLWNDDPDSVFTATNLFPAQITMQDAVLDGPTGWANRHNFRLSDNGGISDAVFMNDSAFTLFADVTITGTANIEGGLNVSPWWSQQIDGVFMLRTDDGEVSCWGGRLPFYNFTANHSVTYTKGETVRLGVVYDPNSLTEADPATIQYFYTEDGTTYTSPVLPFDMGNPGEDPPYGLWGILNDARVGGWFMPKIQAGNPDNYGAISFDNIVFTPEPMSVVLLGAAALLLRRR